MLFVDRMEHKIRMEEVFMPRNDGKPPPDGERCTATAKTTGERCKLSRKPGQKVCGRHGGEAPQAKKKALERLREAIDPLTDKKVKTAEDAWDKYCEAKEAGDDEKMAYWMKVFNKRYEEVADRAGPPKAQRTEMTGENGGEVEMKVDGEGLTPETIQKLSEAIDGE